MPDGTKLYRTAMAAVAPVSALHALVTDDAAPPDELAAIAAAGVAVLRA
ncbi:MAG TPA: hypothetical protein VF482_08720 [Trebonia sp.]